VRAANVTRAKAEPAIPVPSGDAVVPPAATR
jgi:hypothetical protein